jgi:acyl dehydratase
VHIELERHIERLKRKIGHESGPYTQAVEAGAIAKFARAIGETNPLYFDEGYARTTRFGGIIAPPTYASCFITPLLPGEMFELELPPLGKALHSDDVAQHDRPIRPGDVLSTRARYAEVFLKQGRSGPMIFQAADLTITNQRHERVACVRMMSVNFQDRGA